MVSKKYLTGEKSEISYSLYLHFDGDDNKSHELLQSFSYYLNNRAFVIYSITKDGMEKSKINELENEKAKLQDKKSNYNQISM